MTSLLKTNASLRKSHDNIHNKLHTRVINIFKSSSTKSLAKKDMSSNEDTSVLVLVGGDSLKPTVEISSMSFLQSFPATNSQSQSQRLISQSLSQSKLMILAQDDGGIYKGPYMSQIDIISIFYIRNFYSFFCIYYCVYIINSYF